jgi:hypothetical protein
MRLWMEPLQTVCANWIRESLWNKLALLAVKRCQNTAHTAHAAGSTASVRSFSAASSPAEVATGGVFRILLQRAHVRQELSIRLRLAQLVDQQFHRFHR